MQTVFDPAKLVEVSMAKAMEELNKCVPRCANCHRLKTHIARPQPKHMNKNRLFISELKRKPCLDCNKIYEPCQMDFDHRDPAAKFKQGSNLMGFALKTILEEIDKCDLVYANCHREREYSWRKQ